MLSSLHLNDLTPHDNPMLPSYTYFSHLRKKSSWIGGTQMEQSGGAKMALLGLCLWQRPAIQVTLNIKIWGQGHMGEL